MSLTGRGPHDPAPPWGIPATIAWVLLAFLVSIVAATGAYAVWRAGHSEPAVSNYDGVIITIGALASVPVQIAVLAVAIHLRRWRATDYLALGFPKRGELVFAALCVIAMNVIFDGLLFVTGRDLVPPFQAEAYQTAKDAGWLIWFVLAIVIVAPVGEEVVFRGFLYRAFAQPGWEIYAIIVIAMAWAVLHVQYDWVGMVQIFTAGLVLGWFRWASGSTVLTIFMHIFVNGQATLETVIKMEFLS
jgi:membrane protease YdiL (CAAX protease family)